MDLGNTTRHKSSKSVSHFAHIKMHIIFFTSKLYSHFAYQNAHHIFSAHLAHFNINLMASINTLKTHIMDPFTFPTYYLKLPPLTLPAPVEGITW